MTDNLPPHSFEAEQALLDAMLSAHESEYRDELAETYARVKGSFYDTRNQAVVAAIGHCIDGGKPVEIVSVANAMNGEVENKFQYLAELIGKGAGPASMRYYADIVVEKSTRRTLIRICQELTETCLDRSDPPNDALGIAESRIMAVRDELTRQSTNTMVDASTLAMEAINYAEKLAAGNRENQIITGYPDLDHLVCLEPGDLCIIGARPSSGKTSIACNIMENVAKNGTPVGMLSLEMRSHAIALRLVSSIAKVNVNDFRTEPTGKLYDNFGRGTAVLSKLPIVLDYGFGLTVSHAKARLTRMASQKNIKLGIVDYLQLVRPDKSGERRESEVASVVRDLKALAGTLNIPLIVLAQLNRESDKGEEPRRPRLSDLRESGATEQDADEVLLLHPDNKPADLNNVETKLIVAKNRNGPTGDVNLIFRKPFTRFESQSKISESSIPRRSLPYQDD